LGGWFSGNSGKSTLGSSLASSAGAGSDSLARVDSSEGSSSQGVPPGAGLPQAGGAGGDGGFSFGFGSFHGGGGGNDVESGGASSLGGTDDGGSSDTLGRLPPGLGPPAPAPPLGPVSEVSGSINVSLAAGLGGGGSRAASQRARSLSARERIASFSGGSGRRLFPFSRSMGSGSRGGLSLRERLFSGLRVRMGAASGIVPPGCDVRGSGVYEVASGGRAAGLWREQAVRPCGAHAR
jgi:hypothetical protein